MSDDPGRRTAVRVVIVASFVLGGVLLIPFAALLFGFCKIFYIPSEAMAPTLVVNDRLLASMLGPGDLRRGDVVLFDISSTTYIKRVAGLPGDRIAMRGGRVMLNGRPVPQHFIGHGPYHSEGGMPARRLSEQFPGESRRHEIYDTGRSPFDDTDEKLVAPGHIFVLGDNRDHSADSRVSREDFGVEQLPIGDVRGRAFIYLWGPTGRFGERISN